MKKSLLALALAGAFAVPSAAMAVDVSFGGEFDLAVEQYDNGDKKVNQMNNTHSRFWWDMVDDLGTGLMVKGHLELDVGANGYHGGGGANCGIGGTNCNGTSINNRNSYIGLAGESWGEVRFGTQENIHEATGYAVDPFHGAAGPGGNIVNGMGQSGIAGRSTVFNGSNIGARRTDSTITYISPNWGGFTFQVDYALEGPTGTGRSSNPLFVGASEKWTELFYGARYDAATSFGGWRIYAAGADISNGDLSSSAGLFTAGLSNDTSDSGVRAGGGITFGNFAVDFLWETNEWDSTGAGGAKVEREGYWIGGSWMVPTGKIALGYIAMDDYELQGQKCDGAGVLGGGTPLPGSCATTNIALGYYHTLSANSNLYIIYNKMDNDDMAAGNIQNGNIAANQTLDALGGSGYGQDPQAISLGMYLVF
jgi:predicted porin